MVVCPDFIARKTLESSLAQLNQEHVDLLVRSSSAFLRLLCLIIALLQNELVKSRLHSEETEAELVRYKLL